MKKLSTIFLIIILSFFTLRPLFHGGFFPVHDDAQPFRIFEMYKSLTDGMFPVRWTKDFGYNYGYPLFNFYAPLAYYAGAISIFFGLHILTATKVVIALGIIFSGIFMFLFSKKFWGTFGGIISAVLYMYAPYHALDIYVRGDLAESWAYTFIPLLFFSFYRIVEASTNLKIQKFNLTFIYQKLFVSMLLGAVSFAVIIIIHNLTALMVVPFLLVFIFLFVIISKQKLVLTTSIFITLLFGIILSSFYWLPVFTEMKYTNVLSQTGGGFDFHQHFVCWQQFWSSPWGYGGSTAGCTQDGLSFMVGKFGLLLTFIGLIVSFFAKKYPQQKYAFWICTLLLVVSFVLATETSKPLWEAVHTMSFFQFPWRFLLMISFFLAFLSGCVVWFIQKVISLQSVFIYITCGVLVAVIIFIQGKYFQAKEFYNPPQGYFSDSKFIGWDLSQASSEYMPKNFVKPKNKQLPSITFVFPNKNGTIFKQTKKTNQATAIISSPKSTNLHINIAYFPAWHAFVDSTEVPMKQVKNGMDISIPSDKHTIVIKFLQTPIEKTANVISLAGILVLILGIIFMNKPKRV